MITHTQTYLLYLHVHTAIHFRPVQQQHLCYCRNGWYCRPAAAWKTAFIPFQSTDWHTDYLMEELCVCVCSLEREPCMCIMNKGHCAGWNNTIHCMRVHDHVAVHVLQWCVHICQRCVCVCVYVPKALYWKCVFACVTGVYMHSRGLYNKQHDRSQLGAMWRFWSLYCCWIMVAIFI